ncbi:twin BRCT domain-containing protein [Cladophialophora immunda]|nr:twin BRCT domain-containing protein [Cladophialophora immunda]
MDNDQAVVAEKEPGLFMHYKFAIIRSAALPENEAESRAAELKLHDGEVMIDQYPQTRLDLRGITHVISATSDFPDYNSCSDALIPVIKPTWVEHSLAKNRLLNPRQYSPDPRYFMSDVVACVGDLPQGDADAIAGGILAMGGLFSTKLTNQITHIVALSLDSDAVATVAKKKLVLKVVLPHWVDDCLKLGRKIDEYPYQLPHPEILEPASDRAPTAKHNHQVDGAVHPDPVLFKQNPNPPRKLQNVFKKKAIMLANDLGISQYLRETLAALITTGGGAVTDSLSKADMYICKYREGADYKAASREGKDVGNLSWLYFLIQTDQWTSPMRRMLHYPLAKNGLPGFPGLVISLSNYSGEARTYLENMIIATGAKCTKTLKQDNTHLITAHDHSEKCTAAKEWGVHIVNHLWLEESYARWKMQSITDRRYTHFPQRTNLSEVVGSTQLDRDVLEKRFFPDDDTETTGVAKNGPTHRVDKKAVDAEQPSSVRRTKSEQATKSDLGRGMQKPHTPATPRFNAVEKENITPPTMNSRKSKEIAVSRLQAQAEDILLFTKESKRKGGVIYGGRRKSDPDRVQLGRKRPMDEVDDVDMLDEGDAKKSKREDAPTIRLVVSGYKRWVNKSKVEDHDKKHLRDLGILVTSDASKATHLAAPRIVRTVKFVTALAYAPLVISTDFIDDCLVGDKLLDPEKYKLRDKESEKNIQLNLDNSRQRAQKNANKLLQGRCVYCMENIPRGFDVYKAIVEANGGRCMLWKNRKGTIVPSGRADSEVFTDTDDNHDVYLLSHEEGDHHGLWSRFKEMAEGSRKVPKIVTSSWLLETAISQEIMPTKPHELSRDDNVF